MRIENPFSEELLAGRVLGFYRALLGDPAEIKWTPDTEGFMFVKVFRPEMRTGRRRRWPARRRSTKRRTTGS